MQSRNGGSLWQAGWEACLLGMGIPREEATYYETAVEEGRYIVTVHVDGREEAVWQVFRDNHAFDYTTRLEHTHA